MRDITAHRVRDRYVQPEIQAPVEGPQAHGSGNQVALRTPLLPNDILFGQTIILVPDLSHHLFHDILGRDQPLHPPELIQEDGHLLLIPCHIPQQGPDILRPEHKKRRPDQRVLLARILGSQQLLVGKEIIQGELLQTAVSQSFHIHVLPARQVLDIENAADVIEARTEDREPGVTPLHSRLKGIPDGGGDFDSDHLGAGDEDLLDLGVLQLEDLGEDLSLVFVYGPAFCRGAHRFPDLFAGDRAGIDQAAHPEERQEDIGQKPQNPAEWEDEAGKIPKEGSGQARKPYGVPDGKGLWRDLPEEEQDGRLGQDSDHIGGTLMPAF